jgi:ABC-type dipeptide/oligopeptide/nickel transport system permease component
VRASIPLWRAAQRGSLEARFYLAALIILVAGLIGAVIIYVTAPAPDSAVQMYGIANSPQYMQQLRQIGGTAEVVLAQFHQWFDSLWHGKPLAYTVAILCAAAAVACFLAGHFVFFDAPPDPNAPPKP